MLNRKYSEIKNTIARLHALVKQENNLRALSLYTETDNALYTLIAIEDCKSETLLNRVTFQVFDENTKRNSTTYCYFKKDNKVCFEVANTFVKDFKASTSETVKAFKKDRTNIYSTNAIVTLKKLLALHNIQFEEVKATKKERATKKEATKKEA